MLNLLYYRKIVEIPRRLIITIVLLCDLFVLKTPALVKSRSLC